MFSSVYKDGKNNGSRIFPLSTSLKKENKVKKNVWTIKFLIIVFCRTNSQQEFNNDIIIFEM